MKVVINHCFGGFGLSQVAKDELKASWPEWDGYEKSDIEFRSDSRLVEIVERLGLDAAGRYANLAVVEVPDDVEVYISNYDGQETINEAHRSWR